MPEIIANNAESKPLARCTECDRETTHYFSFVLPTNEVKIVCWECQDREDKGYNMKPAWKRDRRQQDIDMLAAGEEK
jgi:hypothetical protein